MSKLKSLLSLAIILLLWRISAHASSHISFEFVNLQSNQQEEFFPVNTRNEIIVASDDVDIRTLLPIQLKIRYDTNGLETTIPANPQQFCRGPTGCSREGPIISEPEGGYLEITAIDKDGNIIAHYQTGTPPPEKQSPSSTPALAPSPTPQPPAGIGAGVVKEQVPEVRQPILSNRNLGILLILIALVLIVLATTSFGCPDLCTEGACQNCNLVAIRTAQHGTEPDEIEGMLKSLDLLGWFGYLPGKAGVSPFGKKLTGEVVERAKKIVEKLKKRGMQINGVDVYATISYEECKRVSCWIFWTQLTWVKAQKEVKIHPFQQYRYLDIDSEAWRPDRLFDEKRKEQVYRYIEREALKNCPEKCRSI